MKQSGGNEVKAAEPATVPDKEKMNNDSTRLVYERETRKIKKFLGGCGE